MGAWIGRGIRAAAPWIGGLLCLSILYYLTVLTQVMVESFKDESAIHPAPQAIVVLGAAQYKGRPSKVYRSRLDQALALYETDIAPVIVLTGGSQGGERLSEGYVGYSYLQQRGVPVDAMQIEMKGHSTYQSLLAARRFLKSQDINRVLLVSDNWHLARAKSIGRYVGFEVAGAPVRHGLYSDRATLTRMLQEAAGISIAQLVGYQALDRVTNEHTR